MGRLFSCIVLSLMLLPAPKRAESVQPVFFSMLFPQLMPDIERGVTAGEAVML